MRGVWTRERIALLKKLWADGETATAIATRLRMSKSAVLGKVFRLRLRPAATGTTATARGNRAILRRRHKKPAAKQTSGEAGRTGRTGNGARENAV
jgi:GcrA cell cycle regulator